MVSEKNPFSQVKGCYFHFSQSLWRQVQALGVVTHYGKDRLLTKFIRMVCALPFIEINKLESCIDELREFQFDKSSRFHKDFVKFQTKFLDYVERVWISGHFKPRLWNLFNKSTDLTNNKVSLTFNEPNFWCNLIRFSWMTV